MINLRPYQREAIQSIFTFFKQKRGKRPLVQAPTGSGKSYMIAGFCNEVNRRWPSQKILIISHVKEILEQDYKALKNLLPTADLGLYSAGLKKKKIRNITIAGIHSIYNKPDLFKQFDIIIVDEAHTIPPGKNSMYKQFFNAVKKPIIGFTATPFRLGAGYLHIGEDSFFDDVIFNISYKKLQDLGHLCQLSTKGTKKKLDAKGIKKQAGDYVVKELSMAFDREAITKEICQELTIYKDLRKKWLVFAIDIEHCEHITEELNRQGISSACVHSKMPQNKADGIIDSFRGTDKYQALVSVAKLTTGFDVPEVDLIALLRPTQSPVLHVQIIGRGMRIAEGKTDCLVLDFAGNLSRLGPIDDPLIKLKGSGDGEPIMKECEKCFEIVHAATRICPCCNTPFKFKHHLSSKPKEDDALTLQEWHDVTEIKYFVYTGSRNIPMLKVSYMCGLRRFNEYVCVQHSGYAKHVAQHWWKKRFNSDFIPETADDAFINSHLLKTPSKILVKEKGKYPEILEYKF